MLLKSRRLKLNKIHFKLTLLFSLIFTSSSIILFIFSFLTFYTSMKAEDAGSMRRRMLNYWAVFQSGGIDAISEEINVDSFLYGDRAFFIRIADNRNKTLFLKYPENWKNFNIEKLNQYSILDFAKTITLSSKTNNFKLEVDSVKLSDKYILQLGMSTARRVFFLRVYQRNFILLLILLVIISIGAGLFVSSRALKPLKDLNSTLKNIVETGNFSKRVKGKKISDDLEEVITLFNAMLSRIESLIVQMKGALDFVAHDLRTPMTRMRGIAELALQNPDDTKRLSDALSTSLEESDKILSMLNAIMDVSEAESGILHLNREPIDIKETLLQLIDMYSYIGERKELNLFLTCEEDIFLTVDPARFRQAVGNLLDNAVKYSPKRDNIELEARKEENTCIISVTDHGNGIAKDELPFIWDRLYRSPSKNKTPGMGLGLSLVKAILKAHGGKVDISSNTGKTTFSLFFPLA